MDGPRSPLDAPHLASTRVTRSSARLLAADSPSSASESPTIAAPTSYSPHKSSSVQTRKRNAPQADSPPANENPSNRRSKKLKVSDKDQPSTSIASRPKRQKKVAATDANPTAMSSGYDDADTNRRTSSSRRRQPSPPGTSADTSPQALPPAGQKKRSSRKSTTAEKGEKSSGSSNRKSKTSQHKKEPDTRGSSFSSFGTNEQANDRDEEQATGKELDDDRSEDDEPPPADDDNMDDEDPFTGNLLGRMAGSSSISNTLRALGGMMSGITGRLRGLLENLRMRDDPSVQLIALTELSDLLLISNEDNLAGHFAPDQFIKELVRLMQPDDFGEENPEMMLLACRCIANLMEAIPSSTASVVNGGAVPVLCQKLLEIHFIDLAEQALSTLEKISVEFPSSIVREGGLTACLTYLDFFATSTQRTAVTTAANCCRGIPSESFPVIKDVMPILLNVLSSNDQRVVEQGSLCVCRIIESFKWQDEKLEDLVGPDLLQAILRLLLPGSTNLIGANIHTSFLRCLAIAAKASPRISVELLRLNVVDTLYQILTGISPPSGIDDIASKIDKNVIMQALIRSPKDQIFETLNVICELLPAVTDSGLIFLEELREAGLPGVSSTEVATRSRTSPNDKRVDLLQESPREVYRFAVVLFPTLMHAYTSTVNLSVRQKVLGAQLKMLFNFDTKVIQVALADIPFASHVASILTQEENPLLVTCALQIAEMLIKRLGHIYRSQFHREGVIAEIKKLADRPMKAADAESKRQSRAGQQDDQRLPSGEQLRTNRSQDEDMEEAEDEDDHRREYDDEGDEDDDNNSEDSDTSEPKLRSSRGLLYPDVRDIITGRAQRFVKLINTAHSAENAKEAASAVDEIRLTGQSLLQAYRNHDYRKGRELFEQLAVYFAKDGNEGITSYELLKSDIVDALLEVFTRETDPGRTEACSAFLHAFMSTSNTKLATGGAESSTTAFSVLVHKLQDLLSRTEHFEVITVHQNAFESNRHSATSMLAKQFRLKLTAADDSGIPKPYRDIMVSIHAIATFRALDDYLRPRISLAEQPDMRRMRRHLLGSNGPKTSDSQERGAADSPMTLKQSDDQAPGEVAKAKPASTEETQDDPSSAPSTLRRSSRRQEAQNTANAETPRRRHQRSTDATESPLECADEQHLSDGDQEAADAAMDAILDDLEDDMDEDEDEPSAVNMEVANSGKVTARKEDGTRVATPQQSSQGSAVSAAAASQRLAAARESLGTPSFLKRAMSYATAVQSIPQDWHIEFSINDQPISNDTTIYRAVHFSQGEPEEVSSRVVWSGVHKITFKRVAGPPPAESKSLSPSPVQPTEPHVGLPLSLSRLPQTAAILQLMGALHNMNNNLGDIIRNSAAGTTLREEPLTQFINTKLTAKLNRQLEEPLIVASNCLPSWSEDLARYYPFLFPFESRHLFLQSTSFGYSRSMSRWQNSQNENESRRNRDERPFLGRTQRQKVRISRNRILESALKVMELYGSSPSILEVEYFEEVGTGLGPTLEFYATISREFSKKKLKLWRENESEDSSDFAFGKGGLFPAPMSDSQANNENGKRLLHLFSMLGKFVARSMLDSRIIDISFNPTFFRVGHAASVTPSLGALSTVDQSLASSLKALDDLVTAKRRIAADDSLSESEKLQQYKLLRIKDAAVEDLGLDFTLPGYPEIELEENGCKTDVTIDNVERYYDRVLDLTLGSGVQKQVEAFRAGFSQVFPYSALRAFTPDELVMLFGPNDEDWSLETLMDSIKADHGFNLDSASIRNLLQTMSEYTAGERRDFLQFVTGSPKLPIGGFKSLTPMFTVVCKPSEPPLTPDDYLPSVMTCVNYLKMPDYTSADILRQKLSVAIKEGQGAFHLS